MRSLASILLTSVCVLSFQALSADAQAKSAHSWSGGISVGVSTDRNAGAGGAKVRGGSRAKDDDEDEEDEEEAVFDDDDLTGDDLLDDLDLDDDDLQDEIAEIEDEEDGIIGNEDEDGDGIADGDLDGDGDIDGGADDLDGDAGDDAAPDDAADAGGDDPADAGDDAPADDAVADAPADDAVADAPADDAVADAPAGDAREFPLGFRQSAVTRRPPRAKRGDRLTLKAGVAHKYAFDKNTLWKTGASYTGANQRQRNRNDNNITALSSGPEFKALGGDLTWGPSVAYARLVQNNKSVFDLYAAAIGAKYKINKKLGFKTKYTYDTTHYQSPRADESYGQKIAFAVAVKPFKKTTAELGYSFKTNDLSPAERERDRQDVKLKFQQDFAYKIFVVGEAAYKWTDFDAARRREPIREDEEYNFGVSLGKEVYKGVNVELQYDHRKFDTNIRNRDTSNDRWALVTGWKF